jgi:hypothetical protein
MVSAYVRWLCAPLGLVASGAMGVGGGGGVCLFPFSLWGFFLCVLLAARSTVCGAPLGVVAGVRTRVMGSTEEMGALMSTYT